jgi:predicted nucleic acid-binding protein
VSASFYCDTSALVKLYHQEVGTERMEELFRQEENVLVISDRFRPIGITSWSV